MAAAGYSGRLYDNANTKYADVDEDGIFAGEHLGEEAAVQCPEPGAKFEDGGQPASFRFVFNPDTHVYQIISRWLGRQDSPRLDSRSPKEFIVRTPEKTP